MGGLGCLGYLSFKVVGMVYDVVWVCGLYLLLGDGWVYFDVLVGMLIFDFVVIIVLMVFCWLGVSIVGVYLLVWCSVVVFDVVCEVVVDLVNVDLGGVVLGVDWVVLLLLLVEVLFLCVGLGYEVIVSCFDDEVNIVLWLWVVYCYGVKVKWVEVDIEIGELLMW